MPAEPAVPGDRFAREILAILEDAFAARLRRLNGRPLGGRGDVVGQLLLAICQMRSEVRVVPVLVVPVPVTLGWYECPWC